MNVDQKDKLIYIHIYINIIFQIKFLWIKKNNFLAEIEFKSSLKKKTFRNFVIIIIILIIQPKEIYIFAKKKLIIIVKKI